MGIALAGIVWAAIERGTQPLTQKGFPQEIGKIMQGSFLLTAVIAYEVVNRRNAAATASAAAAATARLRLEDQPPPSTSPTAGATA